MNTLEPLLEELLAAAEDPAVGVELNIVTDGFAVGGLVRKTQWSGVWEISTFSPQPDGRGGQKLAPVKYWFMGQQVKAVAQAQEEPAVETPKSGLFIPGRNH